MKCRTIIVLAACVSLAVLGGRASAGVIIDESFDANTIINSPVPDVLVGMDTMGMWMGGTTTMPDGMGMWQVANVPDPMGVMTYVAEGYLNNNAGMTMTMDGAWSSLAYFVAQPQQGWGGRVLDVFFDWQGEGFGPEAELVVNYGVYGWQEDDTIWFGYSDSPGSGALLMGGPLADSFDWHQVETSYYDAAGNLHVYDYLGVIFTMGAAVVDSFGLDEVPNGGPNGDSVYLRVDNVRLEATIPEPTSMVLWATTMGAVAYIRRRRKKHRRDTGPPG